MKSMQLRALVVSFSVMLVCSAGCRLGRESEQRGGSSGVPLRQERARLPFPPDSLDRRRQLISEEWAGEPQAWAGKYVSSLGESLWLAPESGFAFSFVSHLDIVEESWGEVFEVSSGGSLFLRARYWYGAHPRRLSQRLFVLKCPEGIVLVDERDWQGYLSVFGQSYPDPSRGIYLRYFMKEV